MRALCAGILLAVTLSPTPAGAAQAAGESPTRPSLATLPESNEALLLSDRVEDAIDAGDYRLALELVDQMLRLPPALVGAPASRTYYPTWRRGARLLEQFPPAGVEVYRRLYDAECAARFEEARDRPDIDALYELLRTHRLCSNWPQVATELADLLMDLGRFGEAIDVLGRLLHERPDDAAWNLRMAIALGALGEVDQAWRRLDAAAHDGTAEVDHRQALDSVGEWLAERSDAAGDTGRGLTPLIPAAVAWTRPLPGQDADYRGDAGLAEALSALRRLPVIEPVLAQDTLLVRMGGAIHAFDELTLVPRWTVQEVAGERALLPGSGKSGSSGARHDELVSHHLRHTLASGFGMAFSIEGLSYALPGAQIMHRPFRQNAEESVRNELVARDLRTGQVIWRTGADPASPLYEAAFQDRPIVAGERLLAAYALRSSLYLAALNPRDGRVLEEVEVIGPPTTFPESGGRCLLATDATSVYLTTGNGVVAAFGLAGLEWRWASVYPSTLAEQRGRLWWQSTEDLVQQSVDRPVLADDLLIVSPGDSTEIMALHRLDGRERWRMPRGEDGSVVGVVRAGVVMCGHAVSCLDSDDPAGRPPRWRSVSLEITGRPLVAHGRIYVPTAGGLVVLDGETGKIVADEWPHNGAAGRPEAQVAAAEEDGRGGRSVEQAAALGSSEEGAARRGGPVGAALLIAPDAVIAVGPGGLVRYPDPQRTRMRCQALASDADTTERALLASAWIDAAAGRYHDALARLDEMTAADEKLAAARDDLYTQVFVRLSRATGDAAGRLAWLRRAAERTRSPLAAQRLDLLIGRALEASGDASGAFEAYLRPLLSDEALELSDESDPGLAAAAWVAAAQRMREVLSAAPQADARALLEGAIRAASSSAEPVVALERLRLACGDDRLRREVERALLLSRPPPELAHRLLDASVGADVPSSLARRLLLARWDVHASLGMLAEAGADRAAWEREFAGAGELSADEQSLIDAIELAMRKVEQAQTPPFSELLSRQWRIERADLILDLRNPRKPPGSWILVRNTEQFQIELRRAVTDGLPLRQTNDSLSTRRPSTAASAHERLFRSEMRWGGAERPAWPAAVYGRLAAVPVPGGLIGLGIGPERYAGRWRWEREIGAWETVGTDFPQLSSAGPLGVCVALPPRNDRILHVGWSDGAVWWQRDFAGTGISRLDRIGDDIVVISEDQRFWLVRERDGGDIRSLPGDAPSLRAVDVVGDALLVWGIDFVARLDPRTLERIWSRPTGAVQQRKPIARRQVEFLPQKGGWLAYQLRGENVWRVLDTATGEPALPEPMREVGELTAVAVDASMLVAAGMFDHPSGNPNAQAVRLRAWSLEDGTLLWSHWLTTRVPVNETQLTAHARFIPVLLDRGGDHDDAFGPDAPMLQLVDRTDGTLTEPISLREDFRQYDSECDLYLLTTPTRIIVQVAGNVIAYGSSALGS